MKMTRVVTLLFSDKKSEEEKGAVEWILLHAKKLKAQLQNNAKKSHPKKRGFWRRFGASFFRAGPNDAPFRDACGGWCLSEMPLFVL
jgi:hypothetical protein